jgi:hypothetical protein
MPRLENSLTGVVVNVEDDLAAELTASGVYSKASSKSTSSKSDGGGTSGAKTGDSK